jgi:hypothetical protein
VPRGMTALKIQYHGHNLIYASESNILIPNVSKLPIEEILASKLPNLPLKSSDNLIFPLYTWDYGFRIKNGIILLPHISLGEQGIFFHEHMILWSAISAYQWQELKDCRSLKSYFLRLYNRKKYCILMVKRVKNQRSLWLEIPVPGSLVTQAHELLVKYLPDHMQVNPPSSC